MKTMKMNKTTNVTLASFGKEKFKWSEKIQDVKQEELQIPNYQYGNSQNTLDYNIALRNKPSSWTPVIWSLSISSLWNVNVSLWFKPSLVTFTSICSSGWWTWAATELSQFWMDNRSFTIIDTQCVYMRNTWWTAVHRTEFTSMDATWFTLNCILATETATVRYIAYR